MPRSNQKFEVRLSAATWDHNLIATSPVPYEEIEALLAEEEN